MGRETESSKSGLPAASSYYFSARIKSALSPLSAHPVSVIEAASGFGKTTAVREYLHHTCEQDNHSYWYTCLGEPLKKAWQGFCLAFSHIDSRTARYLLRLGVPTEDNLTDIAEAMRACKNTLGVYLIIDNFQFIQNELPPYFIDAIANHENPDLHIVFITQRSDYTDAQRAQNDKVYRIGSDSLSFNAADIDAYLQQNNITLAADDISALHHKTEGWVAALDLQRIHYEQTGSFEQAENINSLIESALWNDLDDDERTFMTAISIFDSFTGEQARIMLDSPDLPPYATRLLRTNAFIRYDATQKTYLLHALLRNFLTQEFDKLPQPAKRRIWSLAGKAYAEQGLNYQALCCYRQTNDYHALLSLPLRGNEFTDYLSEGSAALIEGIVEDCPEEIMLHYPRMMLVMAFELYMTGGGKAFAKLCRLIEALIENPASYGLSEEDRRVTAGEYARLESFICFNDIEKMSEKHREALELLEGPATLYDWNDAWTFGQPSVLYLFWSESGALHRELESMDECLPYYHELTQGHGVGAAEAMRAEALLLQGDDITAEAFCHKALYKATAKDQDSICYASELILARIALLRSDTSSYHTALENIRKRAFEGTELGGQKIVDLALAFLATRQGSTDIAEWLTDPDRIRKNLYPIAGLYGMLVHLEYLLICKEHTRVLGLSEALFDEAQHYHFVLPQVYSLIAKSIAQLELGRQGEAYRTLHGAFDIALPDSLFLPFAEHGESLRPLLQNSLDREGVATILDLTKLQTSGIRATIPTDREEKGLTAREREVAELAARGLTNKQIAQQLFVSVDTVKTLLKRIFTKLGIRSRVQLTDIL